MLRFLDLQRYEINSIYQKKEPPNGSSLTRYKYIIN